MPTSTNNRSKEAASELSARVQAGVRELLGSGKMNGFVLENLRAFLDRKIKDATLVPPNKFRIHLEEIESIAPDLVNLVKAEAEVRGLALMLKEAVCRRDAHRQIAVGVMRVRCDGSRFFWDVETGMFKSGDRFTNSLKHVLSLSKEPLQGMVSSKRTPAYERDVATLILNSEEPDVMREAFRRILDSQDPDELQAIASSEKCFIPNGLGNHFAMKFERCLKFTAEQRLRLLSEELDEVIS